MIEYVHPPKKDVMYMVSTDREILLDIQAEQAKQRQELSELKAEVKQLHIEQRILLVRMDDLQTSVYWTLGVVTLIFTMVTLPAAITAIVSLFRKPGREQADSQSIINSLSEAFMKGLAAGKSERE